MILLLRDPLEIYVRAYGKNLSLMSVYCDNIRAFEAFSGEKLLVAYDDLVMSDSAIERIFSFLGIDTAFNPSLMSEVRRESVTWYKENQPSGSQTEGRTELLRFHQTSLAPAEVVAVWKFIRSRLNSVQMKYLRRWKDINGDIA